MLQLRVFFSQLSSFLSLGWEKARCRTSRELWDSGSQTLRRSEEVMTRAGGGSERLKVASSVKYNQQREQTHYHQVFLKKIWRGEMH